MKRHHLALEGSTARTVHVDGVELLAFHGCGYLGLGHEPEVAEAARAAFHRYGASSLASRTTSGNLEVHEALEARLADFLGVERALVLEDGFLADLAVVQGLATRGHEVALLDADAHPSLTSAARLAGLETYDYGSGDVNRALALLDRFGDRRPLVLTDGVFGMHGRLAPVPELLRYLPGGALVVLDDCHGIGVLGERGRGTAEAFGVPDAQLADQLVLTGSLAKALGAAGGFIAGAAEFVESVQRGAETFVTTTGLAPASAAAALRALQLLEEQPERLERLRANTGQLHRTARRVGLRSTGTFLPILRIPFDDYDDARRLSAALHVEGLFAPAIRYPGAPEGGLVRCAVTSEHTAHDLKRLEEALVRHLPESPA